MDENKITADENELDWGPVKIISGKHKGRIGLYDDNEFKDNIKFAVIYFDGMLIGEDYDWIRYEHIAPVTTDALIRRRDEINRSLKVNSSKRAILLAEYAYICSILAGLMYDARFTKSDRGRQIFISYSSMDIQFAQWLAADLRNAGHNPWLDEWEIRAGESIPKRIEEGIMGCDFVVVILSENSVKSNWVEREWQAKYWEEIEHGHVKVIPVLLNQCQIPALLKMKKYADFTNSYEYGMNDLLAAVQITNKYNRLNRETSEKKSSRYPAGGGKIHQLMSRVSEAQVKYDLFTEVPKVRATKISKPSSSRSTKTHQRLLSASKKIAGVEMPDTAWQFVQEKALFPHLETALRLVHECFPEVKSIRLAYEFDWEVENEGWIAINIQVPGEVDKVLEQYLFFNRQITRQIPSDKNDKILLGINGLGNA